MITRSFGTTKKCEQNQNRDVAINQMGKQAFLLLFLVLMVSQNFMRYGHLLVIPSLFGSLPVHIFRRRRSRFRATYTLYATHSLDVSLGNRNNKLFGVLYKQFHLNFMLSACFLNNLPAI